jgi:hypothetical protein
MTGLMASGTNLAGSQPTAAASAAKAAAIAEAVSKLTPALPAVDVYPD